MVTEERATVNLIGSDEVEGTAVFGAEETQIGSIERVVSASKKKGLSLKLKRFPPDLNRRDSQRVKDERIFVH